MNLSQKSIMVKLTGQIIDEIALSLVENANDKVLEVRDVMADSIVQFGMDKPNLVLSAIVYYLNKDPKLVQSHKILLLNCMTKIMKSSGGGEGVSSEVAVMVIQQVFIEITQSKSLVEEWQEAASNVAVSMSSRFLHELMTELFERFQPEQLPHHYVIHTLANLSLANVFGMVPYLKACLGFCLPVMDAVKNDNTKLVFTRMFSNFSEAIIDYLANMDTAPDQNVTKSFYSSEFCTAFELLFNQWLSVKEMKLKSSVIECLGRMSYLLPNDMLQSWVPKFLSVVYAVYKKNHDCNMVTEGLYFILDASINEDIYIIEPYIDVLLVHLFNQSCHSVDLTSSASVKNHNEALRCYSILGKSFPERVVSFALSKLELTNEKARIGALNIIQHLVNYAGDSIKEKAEDIMVGLKGTTNDQNIKIKQSLAQTILKLAHYNYLELEGGKCLIDFILRQCLTSDKPENKEETNKNNNNNSDKNCNNNNKNVNNNNVINEDTLKEFCENVLHLLSSTVPNAALVLWPYLLTYLTNKHYRTTVPTICRTLHQVLKRWGSDDYQVNFEAVDPIPKPQDIFARLFVLLIDPNVSNRGLQILSFLSCISTIIHPKLTTHWEVMINDLVQFLTQHREGKQEWCQNEWERRLLTFLSESLQTIGDEGWLVLCGDGLIRQLPLYDRCSVEKAFLYKCLGVCSSVVKQNEFTKLALTAVFDQTVHANTTEREACACSIGLASRTHLDYVLDWLEGMTKARKKSVFVSFIKEAVGDLDEKYKATMVLSYACIVKYSPRQALLDRMDSHVIGRFDVNINQIKDPVIRECTVRAIDLTAVSMNNKKKNNNDDTINNIDSLDFLVDHFNHRNALLNRLKALMKQESQTQMTTDLRIITITAMSSLVKLKPLLGDDQRKDLFALVVSRVVTLPADGVAAPAATQGSNAATKSSVSSSSSSASVDKLLENEKRMARCVDGLVAFAGNLLSIECNPAVFYTLFEVLKPHLCSVEESERSRVMLVVQELVRIYLEKINMAMMEPLKSLGEVIARILPRCCDPFHDIRSLALSSIQMLMKISLRYEGRAPDYKDEWVEKVSSLEYSFRSDDSDSLFTFVTELSHIMSQKVSIEHVIDYLEGLVAGLSESEHLSQSACSLLLTNCIKSRGPELHGVVDRTFYALISKLPEITNPKTKTGLLRSIRWLTFHHLLKVTGYLLDEPLPLSGLTCEVWQFIGQDKTLIQPITENLVDMLSRTQPIEELSESMWSKDKTYKRATQLSLALTCALAELLQCAEGYSAVVFLFPQLLCQLLLQVTCYCGARPPKVEKKDSKQDKNRSPHKSTVRIENHPQSTPFALSVVALRRFVEASRNDGLVDGLKRDDVWSLLLYENVDKCVEAFTLIARHLVTCQPEMISKIINHLNPILSSPIASQRILVVAVFAEFINQRCADDMTTVNLLVNYLSSRLGDYDLHVKMLCLRGLGNLSSCGKKMLQKYVSMLLSSLTAAMEDGGGGDGEMKDAVTVEAMKAMSKVLPMLNQEDVRSTLVNIAVRIRPCFEKQNTELRSTSLTLFGDLALIGSDECKEPITEQVHMNLVSVLLHLNDPVSDVIKASRHCLKGVVPLLQCEELTEILKKYEAHAGSGYDAFLGECSKAIVKEMPEKAVTYLNTCLTYFKSSQPTIRSNAVLLLGHLMSDLMEADPSQVEDKVQIFRAIMTLLKDEDIAVRIKTATILKHMGKC